MSLGIALQNAISGLQLNSRSLDVTAQNIANVNTEGYSRKIVQQQAVVIAGQGAGVEIADISRVVNEYMIKDLRNTMSSFGNVSVRNEFFQRMQDMFGTLSSDSSVAFEIAELAADFQALADTPENVSLRTTLIERARLLTQQINSLASSIENLRIEVDRGITDAVAVINTQLALVQDLNLQIAKGLALGQKVGELQDQRDIALNKIAEKMDIQHFTRDNGEVVVMTKQGRTLVDRTASTLSHAPISGSDPLITLANGGIGGIMLNGTDITAEISQGEIAGLVALRDQILPNLHSQFQELAAQLHDQINQVHNQGTAFPGLVSVTGTRTVAAGDPPGWSGTFRVAVTDTNGVVVDTTDIAMGGIATVNDLLTALNAITDVTASIDSAGKISITVANGNRISFNEMDSSVTLGNSTVGVSQFLGLNDFFASGNDYNSYGSAYQSSDTTALGATGSLTISGAFGSTAVAYTAGNSIIDIAAAINGNGTLSAAGIQATVYTDGSGYRLRITDSGGDNMFFSDSGTLVSALDIKVRAPGITSTFAVRSDLINDPSLISRGTLSSAAGLAIGDIGLSVGDKSTIQAIANRFNAKLTFAASNQLAGSSVSLSQFATEIVALNAAQANAASDNLTSRQILIENLKLKTASVSGVNLDEEMAHLIILENAYAASARVITVTQELFQLLQNMVR